MTGVQTCALPISLSPPLVSLSISHTKPPPPPPRRPFSRTAAKGAGFIGDGKNFITIKSLKILSPTDAGAAIATVNVENE